MLPFLTRSVRILGESIVKYELRITYVLEVTILEFFHHCYTRRLVQCSQYCNVWLTADFYLSQGEETRTLL